MRRKPKMAKKPTSQATETKVTEEVLQEAVAPVVVEEPVPVATEAVAEPIKKRIIVAKTSVPFRSVASLEQKFVSGQMPVGIAYEIVKEIHTQLYGDFYELNNGKYITKRGNYAIS